MGDNSGAGSARGGVDRELLQAALEQGYFEFPADVTVAELAREFDLTEAETKRRLARGLSTKLQEFRCDDTVDGLLSDPTTRAL